MTPDCGIPHSVENPLFFGMDARFESQFNTQQGNVLAKRTGTTHFHVI